MTNKNTRRGSTQEVVNAVNQNKSHSRYCRLQDSGIFNACRCKNQVILNRGLYRLAAPRKVVIRSPIDSIQDLTAYINKVRSRIKYGMTALFDNGGCMEDAEQKHLSIHLFDKKAFTLIELLVVVLIIGILAAIALPQYQKAVWKSRYSTLKALASAVKQAEEVYFLETGQYTASWPDLSIQLNGEIERAAPHSMHFDWGTCYLIISSQKNWVFCTYNKLGTRSIYIAYAQVFSHSEQDANLQMCADYDHKNSNSIPRKICQADSGLSSPNDTSTNWEAYYW